MSKKFELERFNRDVPNDELIADLQRVATICGKKITFRQYNLHGKYTAGTLATRFGTWNLALATAGILPSEFKNIPNEMLFQNIQEAWRKLGRQPKFRDINSEVSQFGASVYIDRFGTWRKALESFVEFANSDSEGSEVIESLPNLSQSTKGDIVLHKTKRNINWRMQWFVLKRDNFRCVACGRSPAKDPNVELHVDHIKPWSKGGETVLENLQTLCATCNLGKGNTE